MKRILALLVFAFLLNSCDDGELAVQSFDFTSSTPKSCGEGNSFLVYETHNNEALIIEIPQTDFPQEITAEGAAAATFIIDANHKVTYRLYDGNVTEASLCQTPPASTPNVKEEWTATGGTIEIRTAAINPLNETTGANFITKFSHTIVFKNIVFDTGSGTQTIASQLFGIYQVNATTPDSAFPVAEINDCDTGNSLFKFVGSQAITLNLSPEKFDYLFENVATPVDAPRIAYLDAQNKLTYRVFETGLNQNYFCATPVPTTPVLRDLWEAQASDGSTTGIIEVSTTSIGTSYIHTIRFKKVNFQKGNMAFTFGTDYLFGDYTTSE